MRPTLLTAIPKLLLLLICLVSCAQLDTVPQAPDGYDAIRFRRAVSMGWGLNTFTFDTGSVLIADKRNKYGLMYCGNVNVSGLVTPWCIGIESPETIVFDPGGALQGIRPQPPGTFERIKVKL